MERQHPLEQAEREHGKRPRSQRSPAGGELAPGLWRVDQPDDRQRSQEQDHVGEERTFYAAEGPERR